MSEVMRSACPKIVRCKSEAEVVKGKLSWAQMETVGRVGLWRRWRGRPTERWDPALGRGFAQRVRLLVMSSPLRLHAIKEE